MKKLLILITAYNVENFITQSQLCDKCNKGSYKSGDECIQCNQGFTNPT